MVTEVKIRDLIDKEITELIQICHALFSSGSLSDFQVTAFSHLLRHKFPAMTYGNVLKRCEDAAANPPKTDFRFTPSFLSVILRGHEKFNQNLNYEERVLTQAERLKYRQQFLNDLYADFDNFKHGVDMTRIYVWQYVAELLVRCGFAETLPQVSEERSRYAGVKDILSAYRPFVEDCFLKIIGSGKHVSDYIHGFEN